MGSDRVEQCYSIADEGSVAPRRRNGAPTINPVNDFLAAMREEWFWKSNEEKLRLPRPASAWSSTSAAPAAAAAV